MSSTILCIGDQHLDTLESDNIERFVNEVVSCVVQKKPEIVIFMGDMLHYHNTIYIDSLNNALKLVSRVSEFVKTFVIVGNHDMKGPTCFLDPSSHWLSPLKKWGDCVTVVDVLTHHTLNNGKKITLLPYVEPGRFQEALGGSIPSTDCIFCHQEFFGCRMGAMISTEGDKWETTYPPIVSGHIHNRQMVGTNIFYTGSSVQTSFGESTDKTLSIVHFSSPGDGDVIKIGETIWCSQISLNMPQKKTYYRTVDNINLDNIISDVVEGTKKGNKYKLNVRGMDHELKAFKKSKKYKDIVKKGVKVVFKHNETINTTDTESGLSNDKILSFDEILLNEIYKSEMKGELLKIINSFTNQPN